MQYPDRYKDIGENPSMGVRRQISGEYSLLGKSVEADVKFMAYFITKETPGSHSYKEGIGFIRSLLYSAIEERAKLAHLMKRYPIEQNITPAVVGRVPSTWRDSME